MSTRSFACAVALLLAFGCRVDRAKTDAPSDETSATDTADASADGPDDRKPKRVAGVAHTGNIDRVALCPGGGCALTRDAAGGLRLWGALDGSVEPQPVPVRGASSMSIAAAGEGKFTLAVVESSGGAKIFEADDEGELTERAALSPFEPVLEAHVLPGGERILILRRDRSIRLLKADGTELTVFDERRFRPDRLVVSDDGKTAVAILLERNKPQDFKVELVPLRLHAGDEGGARIERAGSPRLAESKIGFETSSTALSPDGTRFVFADQTTPSSSAWQVRVLDLANPDADTSFEAKPAPHVVPQVGFLGNHQVFVGATDGAVSWLHDLKKGRRWARAATPQDFNHQGRVSESRGGVQVMAYGSWLFVHEFDTREFRYLGYDIVVGQTVSVSPSGSHVAWGFNQGPVVIEPIDGEGESVRLTVSDSFNAGAWKTRFLDDDHLIVVDTVGNVSLMNWRRSEVLDRTGVNGSVREVAYLHDSKLLLVQRHATDAYVFRVGVDEGFEGPWLVADNAYRMGLLEPGKGQGDVLWSIDGSNKLRFYTLEELQSDLDHQSTDAKGEQLASGQPAPMAIDSLGRQWGVRWSGNRMEVFVDAGEALVTTPARGNDVNLVVPAVGGKSVALVTGRGAAIALSVHDGKTLESKWSYAMGGFQSEVAWSPDGRYLGVVGNTGAVLLNGKTGEPVVKRCGLAFEVVHAPPPTAFSASGQRSLCEP